jgi:hypothetical protein
MFPVFFASFVPSSFFWKMNERDQSVAAPGNSHCHHHASQPRGIAGRVNVQ